MEEEFIRNQERLKPQEEKIEVICLIYVCYIYLYIRYSGMFFNHLDSFTFTTDFMFFVI
jgi:hypothetical protein